jgi:protein TonB
MILPKDMAGAMMDGRGSGNLNVVATVSLENGDIFTQDAEVAAVQTAAPPPRPIEQPKEAKLEKLEPQTLSPAPLQEEQRRPPDEHPQLASAASQAQDAQTASAAEAARRNKLLSAYQSELYSALERHKIHVAKSGDVLLQVVLGSEGQIVSRQVMRSSGIPELDRAAIAALDRSAPFPSVPPEISTGPITLAVPFQFRVR